MSPVLVLQQQRQDQGGVWLALLASAGIRNQPTAVLSKKHSAVLSQGPQAIRMDASHQKTLRPNQCILELPIRPAQELGNPSWHPQDGACKGTSGCKAKRWSPWQLPVYQLVPLETEVGRVGDTTGCLELFIPQISRKVCENKQRLTKWVKQRLFRARVSATITCVLTEAPELAEGWMSFKMEQ